ncbi:MAG: hypothetical protein HZA49_02950 [Planctomycetes bacterium]|nr:hypothetical protein [Planctomycetota bacterium]
MLFNWFKKKDKLIPLEPLEPVQGKPGHKLPARPVAPPNKAPLAGARKPAPLTKDTAKINTSESTVIRIGKLGEVLLQYNMISRENLEKALALQQKSFVSSGPQDKAVQKRKLLGEILIENNFVTEEQLLSAFARHCRIPYIKLNKYGLPKTAIQSVPVDLVIKHRVIPVDKIGSMLMLAVTDPYDTNAVEEIKAQTGLKVKTILCKQSEFSEMVKFYYPHAQDGARETPADTATETAPASPEPTGQENAAPDTSAKPAPAQGPRVGEETSVFKIEELQFPEPPASQAAPAPTAAVAEKPPETPAPQATEATPEPEDKKEFFLGGTIEEHRSDRDSEHATVKPAAKAESAPEAQPQPLPAQESVQPAQQKPELAEINGYDTCLIDIRDLLASQETSPDENIEILPEEPQPVDVAPYLYPDSNAPAGLPSVEVPINESSVEKAKQPQEVTPSKTVVAARAVPEEKPIVRGEEIVRPEIPQPAPTVPEPQINPALPTPDATPDEKKPTTEKVFKEALVLVSEDEFMMARQLFTIQLAHSWEKLYHRSKPSHAEKVDEVEFAFHTESAIHQ